MKRMLGKVIIVTGASSGLGAATARQLGAEGAKVVLAARRRDKGETVLREIESAGGEAMFVQTDVNKTADVKALVEAAVARFGGLDGAFNNAGVTGPVMVPLADIDEAAWDAALTTNLRAVFVCMKYQIPALLARGGGAIVNMASRYGLFAGDIGNAPYAASKFGVVGLSKTAAIDYAEKGVRVNAICPGYIHSEMVDPFLESEPEMMSRVIHRHNGMNRVGEPEEIAEAVTWLLSAQASFVNGTALLVSGGDHAKLY
ncbi:MAG: SDR family oxidoreductase [Parvularculaceae bacterium]|nr:SDR family oxidoreductase [Parvularculaceae bacterium]